MRLRKTLTATAALTLGLVGLVLATPARAVALSCGSFLAVPNETVVLTADIGPCVDTFAIAIFADNVTLDLNGHTISGDGFQPADVTATWGVYVTSIVGPTANGVTIKGGTITGFNSGVYFEAVNDGTVSDMVLADNIGPDSSDTFGEGVQIFQGGGHTVKSNRVHHNGPFAGIVAYDTSNSTINNNRVTDNNILTAATANASGRATNLANSQAHPSQAYAGAIMQDIGIWVVNLTPSDPTKGTGNTVSGNIVTGNGLDGIQIARFTNGNTVRFNGVSNNGFGQPAGNGARDGSGIANFGNSNLIQANSSTRNGGNGIAVFRSVNSQSVPVGGQNNTIRLNVALFNGSAPNSVAFDLNDSNLTPPCDANTWRFNFGLTRNQFCAR